MNSPQGPTVLRRLVASELRRLRIAGGHKQQDVADYVGIAPNSLSSYEACTASMSNPVAEKIFKYYGVEDERLKELLVMVKGSRKRGWLMDIKGKVWQPVEHFVALERDASSIQEVAIQVVPGVMQTEGYARAVLQRGILGAEVEQHIESRLNRASILERDEPVKYWGIIHEAALRCAVGGKKVMKEQLTRLSDLARKPNITIQVLPDSTGEHTAMSGPYSIFRFNIAPQYGVAYLDYLTGALYLDESNDVDQYAESFSHLIKSALSEKASLSFLNKLSEDLYS